MSAQCARSRAGAVLSVVGVFAGLVLLDLFVSTVCFTTVVEWAYKSGAAASAEEALRVVEGSTAGFSLAISAVQALVFGAWWRHVSKRRDEVPDPRPVRARAAAGAALLGVCLQVVLSVALGALFFLLPGVEALYEPVESSPVLQSSSLAAVLAVGVVAPVAEELIYRGAVFRLVRRIAPSLFWANLAQALLFSLAHGNAVQSSYTVVIGLILGALYMAHGRLGLCMLLHIGVNLSSYALAWLPDAALVVALILSAAGLWFAGKLAGLTRESFGIELPAAEKPAPPDRF